jgi:hypothetical protein
MFLIIEKLPRIKISSLLCSWYRVPEKKNDLNAHVINVISDNDSDNNNKSNSDDSGCDDNDETSEALQTLFVVTPPCRQCFPDLHIGYT